MKAKKMTPRQIKREKEHLRQYLLEINELTNEEVQDLMHTPFSKLSLTKLQELYETKLAKEFAKRLKQLEQLSSN